VRQVGVIVLAMAMAALGLLDLTGARSDAVSAGTDRLRDRLNLGVVAIDARIGGERVHSSGTVIDPRAGLVVTSAHTVWGATSLRLTTGLGVLHGRTVARAPCAGLAVIEIQPRLPGLVALAPVAGGPPPATELLSAVGRRETGSDVGPGGLVTIPTHTAGNLARARFDRELPPLEAIRLDGPVVPDSTGGPLVDADGELVGMAMATTAGGEEAGALAVPWSTIEARLAELEVDERRIYVGWRSYYRCAPALHDYALREHPGYRPIDAVINAPVPATRLPGTQQLDRQ
jgi:S1-C subfamily serine protease